MIQSVFDLLPKNPYRNRPDLIDPYSFSPYVMTRGLGTLGFDAGDAFDTAAAADPTGFMAVANGFVNAVSEWFHIGAGRQEADKIVPFQNEVHHNVLAPISDAVQHANSYSALRSMLAALDSSEKAWLDFLHNTQWDDGRAAEQAEATLAPYFTGLRANLKNQIANSSIYSQAQSLIREDVVPGLVPFTGPGAIPGDGAGGSALNWSTLPVGPQSAGFGPYAESGFFSGGNMQTVLMVGLAVGAVYMLSRRGR